MSQDNCRIIVEDFLKNSWGCVEAIVKELAEFDGEGSDVHLYHFKKSRREDVVFNGNRFFLRASVEYSNPQLTVEEVQGVVAARLLEVCGNYFHNVGLHVPDAKDIDMICELLKKPPDGKIVPFLLNTDEIEPDRYSMNPLKESIVNSGQSAFPCAYVKTDSLSIDNRFVQKYVGSLICKNEIELIEEHLHSCNNSYMDMVDAVKYEQLENLSTSLNMNLNVCSMRMPLSILEKETCDGLLHYIIKKVHSDYETFECAYRCMGRSVKNLTTLLTVPHSPRGYGSKRAARGRIYFDGVKLKAVKVNYCTVLLYPNAVDPADISVAKADDTFSVDAERLTDYDYGQTPSSPQFFLYSLASPENAVLWHGIGAFGASELLKSYTTTRLACAKNLLVTGLSSKYKVTKRMPLQFNLIPKYMWFHPVHRNIDASIGCIEDLKFVAGLGVKMEHLSTEQYIRKQQQPF
jgi:hypothetical protein